MTSIAVTASAACMACLEQTLIDGTVDQCPAWLPVRASGGHFEHTF